MNRIFTLLVVLITTSLSLFAQQPCDFWYVSPNGTGTVGTPDEPVSFIYALNNLSSSRNYIRMLGGTYNFSNKIVLPSDVIIEGGYQVNGNDWVLSSNANTTLEISPALEFGVVSSVNVGHYIGIEAMNVSNFVLRNLTLDVQLAGATGTTDSRGRSIYGIYIKSSTGYEITRVTVNTGSGSGGDSGAAQSGSGGAGGGGNGGDGGNRGNGCSSSQGGQTGNPGGGGAGGGTGGAGRSPGCNGLGCDGSQHTGYDGNPGTNGNSGSPAWSAGDRPSANAANQSFYLPNDATDGGDGEGGGGGGGGGGATGGTCACVNCDGNNGGDGGDGGDGGLGGNGGYGGGGAFAIYTTGTGQGTVTDCLLNPGNGGIGGDGTNGQSGTTGNNGLSGQTGGGCLCGNPDGGDGGKGGDGGNGGRGRDGANGPQTGLVQNSGSTVTQNGTTVPSDFNPVTVNQQLGCTNSEIALTHSGGDLELSNMGSPSFVNDLNPNTSSYTASSSPASVYYTSTGTYDVVINGVVYKDYINIASNRILPSFNTIQDNASTTTICANTVLSMNTSFTGTEFEWTIVSGTTGSTPTGGSTGNSTSHLFATDGTYYVKLRIKDECCGWSIPVYKTITVNPAPATSIDVALADLYCANDSTAIVLSGTPSGGTFSGDGVNGSNFTPANASPGTNIITYTYSGGQGCDGIARDTVEISQPAQLSLSGIGSTACINDIPLQVDAAPSGGTLTGNGVIDTLGFFFFHAPTAGLGQHDLTYTYVDTNNCTTVLEQQVTVNDTPTVTMLNLPDSVCLNDAIISMSGTPSGGTFSGQGVLANFFYPNVAGVGGPYLIEYTYTDQNGCSNTAPYEFIKVNGLPSVNLGPDTFICGQSPLTLDAGNGYSTYNWSTTEQTSSISVTSADDYFVAVTDTTGCVGRDTVSVDQVQGPMPTIAMDGSGPYCEGDTVVLSADSGYVSYLWNDNLNSTTQEIIITQSDTITVSVSDSIGCVGVSSELIVSMQDAPTITITPSGSTELCYGSSVDLLATSGLTNYMWSSGESGQLLNVSESGTYTVSATGGNGCQGTSAPIDVTISSDLGAEITANGPTAFCIGGSVTLDAGAGFASYLWCSGETSQTAVIDAGPECDVVVTDTNGCTDTATIGINVYDPQPQITVVGGVLVCTSGFVSYQWYLDGNAIAGATDATYEATQSGVYSVQVIDDNGCEGEADAGMINIGIDENSIVEFLSVYPNPNNGQVTLEMNLKAPSDVVLTVKDLTGRTVNQAQLNGNSQFKTQLDFQNLSKGVYLLYLDIDNERITRKLIRE